MMASYLLLCLLILYGIPTGKSQAPAVKECYNCNSEMCYQCQFTQSTSTTCADETFQCGRVTFLYGMNKIFTKSGCIPTAECNRTTALTGFLRPIAYNTTCCVTSYCNGGFSIQASQLTFLGALASVVLATMS